DDNPDVLLVILDTVRRDHVTPCNPESNLTPQLEQFARTGTTFCRMVTPGSWTLPVHGSIFTGLLPRQHGADFVDTRKAELKMGEFWVNALRDGLPTLAEIYAEAGYQTILVSENPVLDPGTGITRGFEIIRLGRSFEIEEGGSAFEFLEGIIEEYDRVSKPRFIVVNLSEAHEPYEKSTGEYRKIALFEKPTEESLFHRFVLDEMEPSEEKRFIRELREAYAIGVRKADEDFAEVLSLLREYEWVDDGSLIAVTSDHGEHLGEYRLLDHGRSVHRVNNDVFAVIKLPNSRRIDEPVDRVVQSQDLFPTLLRWSGLEVPKNEYASDLFAPSGEGIAITTSEPDATWQKLTDGRLGRHFLLSLQRDELRVVRIDDREITGQRVPGLLPIEQPAEPPPDLAHAAEALEIKPLGEASPVEIDEELRRTLKSVGYLE
ncbi:MAG: sulfatase-like hydrolase/transferase, partial [Thermoanaerobaculia bacterium]|nr:sulfatase-like hydrolase/transferase [Thermoanaerobaculia bacterium]